jgi:hypothetical protein
MSQQYYEIRVDGHLGHSMAKLFDGYKVVCVMNRECSNPQTILTGLAKDQAALHGVLMRIRDLGLPLISVNRVDPK